MVFQRTGFLFGAGKKPRPAGASCFFPIFPDQHEIDAGSGSSNRVARGRKQQVASVAQPDALPLRPKLSFAGAGYEQDFRRYYHDFYYRYAQTSLAVGILLILADFLVDYLAFDSEPANLYRIQLCLPILGIRNRLFLHAKPPGDTGNR